MPITVMCFKDVDGEVPVYKWIVGLGDATGQTNLVARIDELKELGHRLGEPSSKPIGHGLRELRAKSGHVQYRILYSFSNNTAVLLHGCRKERKLDPQDIKRAVKRNAIVNQNFKAHVTPYES